MHLTALVTRQRILIYQNPPRDIAAPSQVKALSLRHEEESEIPRSRPDETLRIRRPAAGHDADGSPTSPLVWA
ncbi:hypothetical protein ACRE_056080 [Hapsidospora chrysogenum ATCC 11550]|uniref:Uncharacterized protein n=1 Tax=Hapsidospora chrysogenum (strain ATCC 11550 / CBS 779.69 / DSM 880 / IAM 14645 / JCM 23072 / IMI 49137) TaxID=857340 RepID=A0A086T2Q8_HAPC1|nr:hypothetical protein ACRE_056080 [Hapsidospora chrysogenum ATCC 11550]